MTEPWQKQQDRVFIQTKEEWLQNCKRETESGFVLNNKGVGPGSNHNIAYSIERSVARHRDFVAKHMKTRKDIIMGVKKLELLNG